MSPTTWSSRSLSSIQRDDTQIAAAVREARKWDVFVPDDRIQSTVAGGFVTLKGQVDSYTQRDDAARAVRNMSESVAS